VKIATAFSVNKDPVKAITEAYHQLCKQLGSSPSYLVVHSTVTYDCDILMSTLNSLAPQVPTHGGTSCAGVMTEMGFHCDNDMGLALMGMYDPEGAYGVAVAELTDDPRSAAQSAAKQALTQANRPGQVPSMVWVMGAPGSEEKVLLGIGDLFGPNVPIGGGSSGDNTVTGQWKQFANGKVYANAVVVSVLFASKGVAFSFHSGYDPSTTKATVTEGSGRVIQTLNNRPAADLYNEWIDGGISDDLAKGGNILMKTSLSPLGRIVGTAGGVPYFQLSHPDSVTPTQGMTMFSDVQVGDEMYLMRGSHDSLINRAERVVKSALQSADVTSAQVAGALVIYCAGCMLTVKGQMPSVVSTFNRSLGKQTPFLGAFTFGEQGCFLGGENRHGNLMISILIFLK
jgi:hypothetical protein